MLYNSLFIRLANLHDQLACKDLTPNERYKILGTITDLEEALAEVDLGREIGAGS